MNREPLLFHLMLKQGITWFTLAAKTQEPYKYQINKCRYTSKFLLLDGMHPATRM